MEGVYKIKMVPSDLCTEETIHQIADSLDNLNGIIDDIFDRLMTRIQQNLGRTANLMKRIDVSKEKVDKLAGMQTAIKIFSSSKYPAVIKHENYRSILDLDGFTHKPKRNILRNKSQRKLNEMELQEKLQFFHVKLGKSQDSKSKSPVNLRDVLATVPTVGELLIFNTDESPYFGATSKIASHSNLTKTNIVDTQEMLEAAPSSITNRDQVLKRDVDEYLYTPGMGKVPEMEMPLDLPHLPGIAGDLQLSMGGDKAIAPSAVTSPVDMEVAAALPDLKLEEVTLPDVPDIGVTDIVVGVTDIGMRVTDTMVGEVVPIVPVFVPPPPPPPPPPPAELLPKYREPTVQQQPKVKEVVGDAHSNLMAAIRNAGGAGKAKLKPAASSTPNKDDGVKAGGDLMADLHAKLSMRRRGISGADRGGNPMLATIANVIPEPDSTPTTTPQQSSGDEDWE